MKKNQLNLSMLALAVMSALAAPSAFAATTADYATTAGTAGAGSNDGDYLIQSDADKGGFGEVILKNWNGLGDATILTVEDTGVSINKNLTATGSISGATINSTGLATLNSASITGNGTVGGTLGVTGQTTTAGIGNTGLLANTGTFTQTGASTLTGETSINTTGTAATTIGGVGGTTSINSATNNIGVNAFATNNNIGTNSAYSSTNTFGSTNTGTTVNQYGGNSSMSLANGTASLTSGGNGFTSTSAAQVVGTGISLSNGNSASRQLVNGADVVNVIRGNTLVDGNMYINGSLTYSSSSAATTTVTDSSRNTWGGMSVVNAGQTGGVSVDANGKLTTGSTATQATAALTVTNTLGNTHGIVVQEDKTTISGGTRSSSLTMDDNGATFSNSATGAPVQVHGVKDGTADYDAVNVRQFSSAIASVTAMANIPQVDQNKTVAVGVAMGSFMGKSALAAGISYRFTKNGVLKGSVSTAMNSSESTAVGIGAAWSY